MKPTVCSFFLSSLILGTAASASAAPLFAVGDEVEVFLYGEGSVTFDDNVFLTGSNEQDDMYFSLVPGLEVQLSPSGPGNAVLFYKEEFRMYDDFSELDDNYSTLIFQSAYDSGVASANLRLSYEEFAANDFTTFNNEIRETTVDREKVTAHAIGKYKFSTKTAVSVGLLYDKLDYEEPGLSGHSSVAVPVTGFYRVSPALDVTAGYRFRDTNVDNSDAGYTDDYVFVGVDGELGSPKIRGEVKVGYQQRDYDLGGDRSSPAYSASIQYDASASASYRLSVSRDYYTSASFGGTTYTRSMATIQANYRLTEMWSTDVALTYADADYKSYDRQEDQLFAYLGVAYSPNEFLTVRAYYRYTNVDGSTILSNDFSQNLFSISASLRY